MNLTHALDNFSYSWRQEHDDDVPMDFTPDPLWHPWLKTIKAEIQRHVNPPMAMGDGCKSLADKCGVETHEWYLQKPLEEPLIEEARRYACHCGDLGTEIGTLDFQLEVHEELLPESVSRPASRGPDVDLPNEDSESDDFLLMQTAQCLMQAGAVIIWEAINRICTTCCVQRRTQTRWKTA